MLSGFTEAARKTRSASRCEKSGKLGSCRCRRSGGRSRDGRRNESVGARAPATLRRADAVRRRFAEQVNGAGPNLVTDPGLGGAPPGTSPGRRLTARA